MNNPTPVVPALELVRAGRAVRLYEIKGADLSIGRTPGLDVWLEEGKVSRNHARVERRPDGSCHVIDLGSQNGTYLNEHKLAAYEPARLADGCRVRIVDTELVFHDPSVGLSVSPEDNSTVLGSIDDLSSHELAGRVARPAEALRATLDVIRALGAAAELNEILGRVLDGLMAVFPRAQRGFILTVEPDGSFPVRAVRHRDGPSDKPTLSRTIAQQVLAGGEALLISDATVDPNFKDLPSVSATLRTALCVPLPGHSGPVGMAQFDSRNDHDGFTKADLDLLAALAVPVGVAVENHRLLKLQASWAAAGRIQLALLPRRRPALAGYTFWECYRPAQEVGGDLYDYIAVEPPGTAADGRWAVTVGDVSGKGMPAALVMAETCPEIRYLVRAGLPLPDVLGRVSRRFVENCTEGFVTLILTEIDPRSHTLTVASAGHMAPLVRRAGGALEEIGGADAGTPLGADPSAVYRSTSTNLGAGDVVVLYSDGVTDALDRQGRRFGLARLKRALTEAPPGAAAAGETIMSAVRDHAAGREQFDDITLVCFGRDSG
jgi:serine phosphatase RsbU (regulator of sigma subunit)